MKRAHVEVFPYVRMTLDDVVIREVDGQDEFLSTEHLFIDLRVFPLLKRKVLAKRIALDMPKVKIKRGPDGKLNISDLFTATADTTSFTTPLLGEELSIADGEITFEDTRSEEHTSELQSRLHLVCRLLLEKKKKNQVTTAERREKTQERKS